jgi:hypothetical protein
MALTDRHNIISGERNERKKTGSRMGLVYTSFSLVSVAALLCGISDWR